MNQWESIPAALNTGAYSQFEYQLKIASGSQTLPLRSSAAFTNVQLDRLEDELQGIDGEGWTVRYYVARNGNSSIADLNLAPWPNGPMRLAAKVRGDLEISYRKNGRDAFDFRIDYNKHAVEIRDRAVLAHEAPGGIDLNTT